MLHVCLWTFMHLPGPREFWKWTLSSLIRLRYCSWRKPRPADLVLWPGKGQGSVDFAAMLARDVAGDWTVRSESCEGVLWKWSVVCTTSHCPIARCPHPPNQGQGCMLLLCCCLGGSGGGGLVAVTSLVPSCVARAGCSVRILSPLSIKSHTG